MTEQTESDITSPKNRWIKLARSLHRRRQRYRERAILVEGVRPIREAADAGISFTVILLDARVEPESSAVLTARELERAGNLVLSVSSEVFQLAANTETPQGILALCQMPEPPEISHTVTNPLILIIDQVRDPGNVGTLLRSARGAGADAVYLTAGSADPWSPKVIRAGAGSQFRCPINTLDWDQISNQLSGCTILIADADSGLAYDSVDWTQPTALIVGNETKGVSEGAIPHAHGTVGIPLANSLESLNAGVAGSVILFEASRHRRKG